VDYLSLTPAQRRADYRRRVERLVREHPEDAAAQLTWLRLLVEEGESPQAVEVARKIVALKPPASVLADAGRALLEARQYAPAQEVLAKAAGSSPEAGIELDLAIAAFHADGPAEGMRQLDHVPESARAGDYYLARAEMLDASGDASAVASTLEQAVRASPREAGVYRQVCVFLLRKGRTSDALRASDQAMQSLPGDREAMLLRAVVLERATRTEEAERLLEQVQNRWPEWPASWLADGIILGTHGQRGPAAAALRTAMALGANSEEVKSYADAISTGADGKPPDLRSLLLSKASR